MTEDQAHRLSLVCFFFRKCLVVKFEPSKARWWQVKYVLCSPQSLGKWSNLTSIFFKWVGSTTNQKVFHLFKITSSLSQVFQVKWACRQQTWWFFFRLRGLQFTGNFRSNENFSPSQQKEKRCVQKVSPFWNHQSHWAFKCSTAKLPRLGWWFQMIVFYTHIYP